MFKHFRVFALVLLSLTVLSGTASALSTDKYDVKITIDGAITQYRTSTDSVQAFLADQNISVGPFDQMTPAIDTKLSKDKITEIVIKSGFLVSVDIDGSLEKLPVLKGTSVSDVINSLEKDRHIDLAYGGLNLAALASPNNTIELVSMHTDRVVSTSPIMFETQYVDAPDLDKDIENVVTPGVPGELTTTTEIKYKGNEVVDSQVVSNVVTKEAVDAVIQRGSREEAKAVVNQIQTEDGPKNYTKMITMNASAYTSDYESTGKKPGQKGYGITATGVPAAHGIVAVDPRVIPLGTKLFVEGYGISIAADTGGAIKGNKIDLYHDSEHDASEFGRRNLKVYILAEQ